MQEQHINLQNQEQQYKSNYSESLYALDRLAWLCQRSTKSCTAITTIRTTLLITDNAFNRGTTDENFGIKYIETVLSYFLHFVSPSPEKRKGDAKFFNAINSGREQLLGVIFEEKFKGYETGVLKPAAQHLKAIKAHLKTYMTVLLNAEGDKEATKKAHQLDSENECDFKQQLKRARIPVATAWELGRQVIRRIVAVENFLKKGLAEVAATSDKPEEQASWALGEALRGSGNKEETSDEEKEESSWRDKKVNPWLITYSDNNEIDKAWYVEEWQKEKAGVTICLINGQENDASMHAEAQLVDFLLAIGVLTNDKDNDFSTPIIIGISRQCCLNCIDIITFTNEVLKEEGFLTRVIVSDAHFREFSKWHKAKPPFLLEDYVRQQISVCESTIKSSESNYDSMSISDENEEYLSRTWKFGDKIRIKFNKKYAEFYCERYRNPDITDSADKNSYTTDDVKKIEKIFKSSENLPTRHSKRKNTNKTANPLAEKATELNLSKKQWNKKLVVYCLKSKQKKDKEWYYAGLDYVTEEIQHVRVLNNFITFSITGDDFSSNTMDWITEDAESQLGYRTEIPEVNMSQESRPSTPYSDSTPSFSPPTGDDVTDLLEDIRGQFYNWENLIKSNPDLLNNEVLELIEVSLKKFKAIPEKSKADSTPDIMSFFIKKEKEKHNSSSKDDNGEETNRAYKKFRPG